MKKSIFGIFVILPCFCYGEISDQCTTAKTLIKIRPGAAWVMQGDSMEKLQWLDKNQKKPTVAEVEKAKKACIAEEADREERKKQARLDVKNSNLPIERRFEALVLLMDMDK